MNSQFKSPKKDNQDYSKNIISWKTGIICFSALKRVQELRINNQIDDAQSIIKEWITN